MMKTMNLGGTPVFTTGQIGKMCRVAPRTVVKWVDSGKLKAYRLPGSLDRRIPRPEFLKFLRESGMQWVLEDAGLLNAVLVVSDDHALLVALKDRLAGLAEAPSMFDAGRCFEKFGTFDALVVDSRVEGALRLPGSLNGNRPQRVVAIDALDAELDADVVRFDRPFDIDLLAASLLEPHMV